LMGVPALIGWVVDKYCFIGYFALIGTGFTTIQGDQISKVVLSDNKVLELKEAGLIGRKDTTIKVTDLHSNSKGEISGLLTLKGDTIGRVTVSDNAFKSIIDNSVLDVPIYNVKNSNINHFLTVKGEKVTKFKIITSFYNYTLPMLIFMMFGVIALLFAYLLKLEDKAKGYGLELPSKSKSL
jgi:hypothetical protein